MFFTRTIALSVLVAACAPAFAAVDPDASQAAVDALKKHLESDADTRDALSEAPFAATPLSRDDADAARQLLWQDHAERIRRTRADEMNKRRLTDGKLEMPFYFNVSGEKPEQGRSLFISLHGGGGAPKFVNDSQWENQKRLYRPAEGVYLVPRAPTDTWNLWHQGHIDSLFDRLIENLIVFEQVDPNRVYLMGYSAGGDGVYQLGPRMADRWAAASMMAGHPNEASPLGLRNIAFSIHVGANDAAFNRNKVAEQWGERLAELRKDDPDGYEHFVKLYAGKGHWMDREDAAAVPWMAKHTRNPLPKRIVWRQDDVTHRRFYWLAVADEDRHRGAQIVAALNGQQIDLTADGVPRVAIRLSDRMLDMDRPVTVRCRGTAVLQAVPKRTIATLAATLAERGDPQSVFSAEITIEVPAE